MGEDDGVEDAGGQLPMPRGAVDRARPADDQQAHDGHEGLLHHQHAQEPPDRREPGQQADQGRRLGQLVRDRVQHLAQVADHMEVPGDEAVGDIRGSGEQQHPGRQRVVLPAAVQPHDQGDQQDAEHTEQVGDSEDLFVFGTFRHGSRLRSGFTRRSNAEWFVPYYNQIQPRRQGRGAKFKEIQRKLQSIGRK